MVTARTNAPASLRGTPSGSFPLIALALGAARVQHHDPSIDCGSENMGLLDQILGGLTGGLQGQGQAPMGRSFGGGSGGGALMALLPIVLSMLSNRGGGTG